MEKLKVRLFNLGCKVNAYETRAVATNLLSKNYILTIRNDFDVAIINTCTVTHVASQKSRQHIRKIRSLSQKAIIVVMGCYAQNNSRETIENCGADIVVGVSHRNEIDSLIKKFIFNRVPICVIDDKLTIRNKLNYEELGTTIYNENTRAYVKICDGCNRFCSYCIIPHTRGRLRSRSLEEILREICVLIKRGFKEIVLTGVDMSSYGTDLNPKTNLSNLLLEILEKFPSLYRLRLSSLEVEAIDKKFLDILQRFPNFADHLHIPLQAGCDEVLKAMHRTYLTVDYFNKINLIKKIRPRIAITTDIIVGFPKESDEMFLRSIGFIKKCGFMNAHIFPYSPRENTLASTYKDLSSLIKKQRVKKLIELVRNMHEEYLKSFYGEVMEVLIESNNHGLTSNYIHVNTSGNAQEIKKVKLNNLNVK